MKRGTCYHHSLTQNLVLNIGNEVGFPARLPRALINPWTLHERSFRVVWRTERQVEIPRGEVADWYTPQTLSGVVEVGELAALIIGDTQMCERVTARGLPPAINVQICKPSCNGENADDTAVLRRDPVRLIPIVVPNWHCTAHREVQEVFYIMHYRSVEAHLGRSIVGCKFNRVGVPTAGRQFGWHRRPSSGTDRVLSGSHSKIRERLRCPIGKDYLRLCSRWKDQSALTFAVLVRDQCTTGDLHRRAIRQVDV